MKTLSPLGYLHENVAVALLEAVSRQQNLVQVGDLVLEFALIGVDVIREISDRVDLVLLALDQRLYLLKTNAPSLNPFNSKQL